METKVGGGGKLQPVDKEQKYTDEVNWRIKWAKDNGVELPLNKDGSLDDLLLGKLYEKKMYEKEKLANFVTRVKNGAVNPSETIELGEITTQAKKDIECLIGIKINATKHVIGATEIAHILNRHGEFGKADHSMATQKDFEDIEKVLCNYDNIKLTEEKSNFRNGNGENAPIILYYKKLDAKTQIVAEAVTDGKKNTLRVLSAYKKEIQK